MESGVRVLEFMSKGIWLRVQDSGFRVYGWGFRSQGFGFEVRVLGLRVLGMGVTHEAKDEHQEH